MKKRFLLGLLMVVTASLTHAEDADSLYAQDLLKPGTVVPELTLKNYKGEDRSLSKMRDAYVVLDFWASWCPDCRKDIPKMKELHEKYQKKYVQFMGVSFDTDYDAWQQCVRKNSMYWTQVIEPVKMRDSQVAKDFGVKWIPSMYLIDREGKVVLGTVDIDKLASVLDQLDSEEQLARPGLESYPSFPGGNEALMKYLTSTIRYPGVAQKLGVEAGRIVCSFMVNKDGSVSDVQVERVEGVNAIGSKLQRMTPGERNTSIETSVDLMKREAVRVVSGMPNWEPAKLNGKPVKMRFHVPISFKLR